MSALRSRQKAVKEEGEEITMKIDIAGTPGEIQRVIADSYHNPGEDFAPSPVCEATRMEVGLFRHVVAAQHPAR